MTADADDGRCERVNEMWKIWHHAYSQVPFNFLASHYTTHWRDITLAYYNIVKFTWIINERQKWSTTHFQNIHLKFSIPLYALHSKFTVTKCVAKNTPPTQIIIIECSILLLAFSCLRSTHIWSSMEKKLLFNLRIRKFMQNIHKNCV